MITHCNGEPDIYGYPLRIWAYDQPESIGWYGEEAVVGDWQIIPAPLDCGLNLWEIAALPLRAPTAYHLWRRGHGIFRVKVPREKLARLNVLGFGGGVSELFLMLAPPRGAPRLLLLRQPGAARASREARHHADRPEDSSTASPTRDDVKALHQGRQEAHRRRRHAPRLRHAARPGVRGRHRRAGARGRERQRRLAARQEVTYNSAGLSVKQITLDHTHYETIDGCNAATELYGTVFKPTVHEEIYPFEDLPRAMHEMHQNTQTGIPIIRVAKDMPATVKSLL